MLTDLNIRTIFAGIANDLKPTKSICSFGYGAYHEINAKSAEPYPLLWLESDISHNVTLTQDKQRLHKARIAVDLLDQISIGGTPEEMELQKAQIKSKLQQTWNLIFNALVKGGEPSAEYKVKYWINEGWNDAPLEKVNNDQTYGFRYEFAIESKVTPNDCAFAELTGKNINDYLRC